VGVGRGSGRSERGDGGRGGGRGGPREELFQKSGNKSGVKYTGDGHEDPELQKSILDDPREGKIIYRNKGGRNTESFLPESTFVRPEMRLIVGENIETFKKPLKHDDVVIVPSFACDQNNLDTYYKLVEEMRSL
jgi:hypothetical protein